jgi:hypothetical protein
MEWWAEQSANYFINLAQQDRRGAVVGLAEAERGLADSIWRLNRRDERAKPGPDVTDAWARYDSWPTACPNLPTHLPEATLSGMVAFRANRKSPWTARPAS